MVRTLLVYLACIVVASAVMLRVFQPGDSVASTSAPRGGVEAQPFVVLLTLEDNPDDVLVCHTTDDRISVDALQMPTRAQRERLFDELGCN